MSLIDWSDPNEMLGLLVDYVTDEANTLHSNRERKRFLRPLSKELRELAGESSGSVGYLAQRLAEIRSAQPEVFLSDPVVAHLDACIEELLRIEDHSP